MMSNEAIRNQELSELCNSIRNLVASQDYDKCGEIICQAMGSFPCDPQPHNLLGIVFEKVGNHVDAMKQFRAASALDPTYAPARQNLTTYGTFYSAGSAAFDESDCPGACGARPSSERESHNIGQILRRKCS